MKRYYRLLLWLPVGVLLGCCFLMTGGCTKNRLFTTLDSIPEVPSQFHFFNAFAYDSTMLLSVDGLARQSVKPYTFSSYYPSSSAFNLNAAQPNSKLLTIADPVNASLFGSSTTFQFQPLTSYLVYPTYAAYDTLSMPENTIQPTLVAVPEDINHPFDGTARIRFIDMTAGQAVSSVVLTPNAGAGTSLTLTGYGPPRNSTVGFLYQGTQPGEKIFTMQFSANGINVKVTYQQVPLNSGRNYTFMAVGDPSNYLNGIQPMPKLLLHADGDTTNPQPLTVSSVTYPGNYYNQASVTVVNGAYNIPGIVVTGDPLNPTIYSYINVAINQANVQVMRWPIPPADPTIEDVGDGFDQFPPSKLQGNPSRIGNTRLDPGIYTVSTTPNGIISPQYNQFTYGFQENTGYTVCLVPNDSSATRCGSLVLQNDVSPLKNNFKLRFINLMGGAPQLDVHLGSPSGPLLASGVPFDQATDYIPLNPNSTSQDIYVTVVGTTTPLFPQGGGKLVITFPFTAGNSATVFLMGRLAGTPYSGDPGYFGPYSVYVTDAFLNPNNIYNGGTTVQLYY